MTAGSKPALFIGSSSEGLDFTRAVRSLLAQDAEVTLWNEGFFLVGDTFIDSLDAHNHLEITERGRSYLAYSRQVEKPAPGS